MNLKRFALAIMGIALIYGSLNLTQQILVTVGLYIFVYLITSGVEWKKIKDLEATEVNHARKTV